MNTHTHPQHTRTQLYLSLLSLIFLRAYNTHRKCLYFGFRLDLITRQNAILILSKRLWCVNMSVWYELGQINVLNIINYASEAKFTVPIWTMRDWFWTTLNPFNLVIVILNHSENNSDVIEYGFKPVAVDLTNIQLKGFKIQLLTFF